MAPPRTVLLVLLVALFQVAVAADSDRFKTWMPKRKAKFEAILAENCSAEYSDYVAAVGTRTEEHMCDVTVSCILSTTDEASKAILASANILLGLVPVILTLVGPSTGECALLSVRRPLLSLLVAMGSPSRNPMRGATYWDAVEENIKQKAGRLRPHRRLSPFLQKVIVAIELIIAAGACVNVFFTSWRIGASTIFSPWCSRSFGPLVWAGVGILGFLLGSLTFSLRTLQIRGNSESGEKRSIWRAVSEEFIPCGCQSPSLLRWKDESYVFALVAWTTSMFTIAHLIFGTFWFSALLFITVTDALNILGRYMGSAVACRAILMYELAGLRETMEVEHEKEDDGGIYEVSEREAKSGRRPTSS